MKTSINTSLVIALLAMSTMGTMAQDAPLGPLSNVTEFTIKPGHQMQFREGIKAWKACYEENNGPWTWNLWQKQNGEGTVYVLASTMANWAEMDATDESAKDCQLLAINMINPHIEKAVSHINRLMPEISNSNPFEGEVIRVQFFKTNSSHGFQMMEVVKEVESIRREAGISVPGYWYSWQTSDPDSPNYHVVSGYEDFAAMDTPQEGVWESVEKLAGKAKREELQNKFRSAMESNWTSIYKLDKEISRTAN